MSCLFKTVQTYNFYFNNKESFDFFFVKNRQRIIFVSFRTNTKPFKLFSDKI